MKFANIIFICLAILVSPNFVIAGSKVTKVVGKNSNKINDSNIVNKFSDTKFNMDVDNLGPYYLGVDLRLLYKSIVSRASITKDEYETTAEFNKRIEYEHAKPLIGNIFKYDLFSMSVKPTTQYDADTNKLNILVDTNTVLNGYDTIDINAFGVPFSDVEVINSHYSATNAYGAIADVRKTVNNIVYLALINPKKFGKKYIIEYTNGLKYELNGIDANSARSIKDNIRVLFVCKLAEPLISDGLSHKKPTINDPTEIINVNSNVYGEIKSIITYNLTTGYIYSKVTY